MGTLQLHKTPKYRTSSRPTEVRKAGSKALEAARELAAMVSHVPAATKDKKPIPYGTIVKNQLSRAQSLVGKMNGEAWGNVLDTASVKNGGYLAALDWVPSTLDRSRVQVKVDGKKLDMRGLALRRQDNALQLVFLTDDKTALGGAVPVEAGVLSASQMAQMSPKEMQAKLGALFEQGAAKLHEINPTAADLASPKVNSYRPTRNVGKPNASLAVLNLGAELRRVKTDLGALAPERRAILDAAHERLGEISKVRSAVKLVSTEGLFSHLSEDFRVQIKKDRLGNLRLGFADKAGRSRSISGDALDNVPPAQLSRATNLLLGELEARLTQQRSIMLNTTRNISNW
ncbi:MAG: hypothetical protein K1X64_09390 [Myxococcaceae bacterium]|nr:hypothetical protein [Myxococcaceae bacterium]